MTFIRTHWRRISTGVMLLALVGLGGHKVYRSFFAADCCAPGAACCHPGAACCHGSHGQAQAMR